MNVNILDSKIVYGLIKERKVFTMHLSFLDLAEKKGQVYPIFERWVKITYPNLQIPPMMLRRIFEESITDESRFAKSIAHTFYNYFSQKMSNTEKSEIGNIISEYDSEKHVTLEFAPLNPEYGAKYYYNGGSCLWGSYSIVPFVYQKHGAYAIRAFKTERAQSSFRLQIFENENELPTKNFEVYGNVIGREFVFAEGQSLFFLNSYGVFRKSELTDVLEKELQNKFRDGWDFYGDSDYYYTQDARLMKLSEKSSEVFTLDDDLINEIDATGFARCEDCGALINLDNGEYARTANDDLICENCMDNYVYHASGDYVIHWDFAVPIQNRYGDSDYIEDGEDIEDYDNHVCRFCEEIFHEKNMVKLESGEWVCDRCFPDTCFVCEHCGKSFDSEDGTFVPSEGETYCEECLEESFEKCPECLDIVKSEEMREWKDTFVCPDCYDGLLTESEE